MSLFSGLLRSAALPVLTRSTVVLAALSLGQPALAAPAAGGLSNQLIGVQQHYIVREGDTLGGIARTHGLYRTSLARQNGLSPDMDAGSPIYVGQALQVSNQQIVPTGVQDGLLINLPQRRLFQIKGGRLMGSYSIAAGSSTPRWQTPTGRFTIQSTVKNPTWFVPRSIQAEMREKGEPVITRIPAGPDNPLGPYWIGLSLPGIGIHGTISPDSITRFESHGCIRLANPDIARLFRSVKKGDRGQVVYQPVLLARTPDGRIYLEVHDDTYNKGIDLAGTARRLIEQHGLQRQVNWDQVQQVLTLREGVAREIGLQQSYVQEGERLPATLQRS